MKKPKIKLNINKRAAAILAVGLLLGLLLVIWAVSTFMPYNISDPAMIPPDSLSEHDFAISDNRLLLLNTKGIQAYDKKGEYRWDYALKTASPMFVCDGDRLAVADIENAAVYSLKQDKLNYTIESATPVTGVTVNKHGYTGVLSAEHGYRSILTVYDDYGNEYYKWYSGEGYISAFAVSDNNSNLVTAAVSDTESAVQTVLHFFDMDQAEPLNKVILDNEIAYKLMYSGNDAYLLTDKGIYRYNKKGVLKNEYPFQGKILHAFAFEDAADIAIALSRTDETGSMLSGSDMVFLSSRLAEKASCPIDFEVSAMDAKDGFSVVSGLRNVWVLKDNGKVKTKTTLKSDCERLKLFKNGKGFVTLAGSSAGVYTLKMGF